MTKIPKALVYVTTSFAVEPTEQQLLDFYKDYGYDTIDEILEGHGGGYWNEVIREWFVNTYYVEDHNQICKKNNILKYESDSEEEEVSLIDDDKWNELKNDDLIY